MSEICTYNTRAILHDFINKAYFAYPDVKVGGEKKKLGPSYFLQNLH